MKVLSWLVLMLCIVTLAFLALTLASASVMTSVKVIVTDADKSLVEGALQALLKSHPMGSTSQGGQSSAPAPEGASKVGQGPEPEIFISVDRSPEGCAITDSIAVVIPMHRRVEHLLFGNPPLHHLTPAMVGEALRKRWSNPNRACITMHASAEEPSDPDAFEEGQTTAPSCDSCWTWRGLNSRQDAQVLQGFLTRQGWALSDSAAFPWTIMVDSLSLQKTSGTSEDVTTFILCRPL